MSESERMPGYRNRSHVPPIVSRPSKIAKVLPGSVVFSWQAAPTPDRPAPTISTSRCSVAAGIAAGRSLVAVTVQLSQKASDPSPPGWAPANRDHVPPNRDHGVGGGPTP